MTTNTPDALDEALVRPGRIDVKVEFTKASAVQVREIFVNMYRSTFEPARAPEEGESEIEKEEREHQQRQEEEETRQLRELADQFARKVPGGKFSPAELQDYILLRKDQPLRAVQEVEAWVERESEG